MRFGVSTSSLGSHVSSSDDVLRFFEELSFSEFLELNYRLPNGVIPGIKKLVSSGRIKVYSVHNFLPPPPFKGADPSTSEPLNLASMDEEERKLAVRYTLKTIDTLVELEGEVVVLHCGKVLMEDPFELFSSLFKAGDMKALSKKVREVTLERKRLSQAFLERTFFSLDTIVERAFKEGIGICVENRLHPSGIPFFKEFGRIFLEFEGAPLYYLHDVGHGEVMRRLGLMDPVEQLSCLRGKTIAFHVHDVKGLEDHLPPGIGDVDYSSILPFMDGKVVIYEVREGFKEEDICRGHRYFIGFKEGR